MGKMKEYKQFGVYSIIVKENRILLINKVSGPYDKLLDLPGGTIEFTERPIETLKRELKEEVGIDVIKEELYDADSVSFDWKYDDMIIKVHHTGIFYKVLDYTGEIRKSIDIDNQNDDSLGAEFYDIAKLEKNMLSKIAILELEKLGFKLK